MKHPERRSDYEARAAIAMLLDDARHLHAINSRAVTLILRDARERLQDAAIEAKRRAT